jgi:hypothetical protein
MARPTWALLVMAVGLIGNARAADPDPAGLEFFEKNVRPLLVERCQKCHNGAKQKGDLRLDVYENVLNGGGSGPAVVPGKPEESLLVEAINYDGFVQMPPKSKLGDAEIATLTRWVEMGAPWPKEAAPKSTPSGVKGFDLAERATHWSFQPIRDPAVPDVTDGAWPRDPIDRFILAKLEETGLKPAPEADRRSWIRRASFDLIGLPPTPEEINAFLADSTPEAYEHVIDRLLASPHYGERWGRHWLDLVRYAETSGHEFDYNIPNAWRYRDYVIRALNDDLPYDRFVTEHIAGDLVPNPRRNPADGNNESILATGFYFLGEGVQSPVDVGDDAALRVDNQIDVTTKTFLGLTVACARCHDHKFDAIRAADYYALAGILRSSRHQQAVIDPPTKRGPAIAEMEAIRAEIPTRIADKSRLADYLLAARRVLDTTTPIDTPSEPGEILFADFEGPVYGPGWTTTGSAFGDGPIRLPVPDYQGNVNCRGLGLVGSHNGRLNAGVAERDALTGTLSSPPFIVDRDYLHFLIGGGSHAGKTCVEILVDGRVVVSETGRDENPMKPRVVDMRPYRGKSALLRVVDDDRGGWGNISLDHVVFSDRPTPSDGPLARVPAVAKRVGLDEKVLAKLVETLKGDASRQDHPLHLWAQLATEPNVNLKGLTPTSQDPTPSADFTWLADFRRDDFREWTVTGDAFGNAPTGANEWRIAGNSAVPATPGQAHSGRVSDRLQGVLRSKTFTIANKYIHTLCAGRSGRINVVIDGFEKIRAPIYGGLTVGIDHGDELRWLSQDVSMWNGHRAYLEFADGAALDYNGSQTAMLNGDGWLAIAAVGFSDGPPPATGGTVLIASTFRAEDLHSFETIARRYETLASSREGDPAARTAIAASCREIGIPLYEPSADLTRSLERFRELDASLTPPTLALAVLDGPGADVPISIRGSYKTPGEIVPRRSLEAVPGGLEPIASKGSGRLELAERMLSPANPFLARVIVNRVWKHHFGEGIFRTPDDLGHMGQPPSHPELLDHLATRFRAEGWSLKHLHREIMLSSVYRMSSRPDDAEAERLDPTNALLHRMNVRRLEAEPLRDAILAISGRLDLQSIGGPSVPTHLTSFMEGRGRPGQSGPMDGDGRRSIYLAVRRNFLQPMLLAFDAPTPASTIGRRNVSNVPAQALILMNDPFVISQAKLWGERAKQLPAAVDAERIAWMYEHAFGRSPTDGEIARATAFLASRPKSPWADLAHVLMNLKEFSFVN